MHPSASHFKQTLVCRVISASLVFFFSFGTIIPPDIAQAQVLPMLPLPGAMVTPTPGYVPALIKGITIHPENPLEFDFIIDTGDSGIDIESPAFEEESIRLIKYFLASLTVPEEEMWVNLSPYEKDRIIPESFGNTEMGINLLAQDYILKQLTASLMYPEEGLGKTFWERVYARAQKEFGTTDIPVESFHKVWILPEEAVVYQKDNSAFVIKSRLKVMMEEDYLAMRNSQAGAPDLAGTHDVVGTQNFASLQDKNNNPFANALTALQTEIMREIIIPEIEKEVNEGQNFAQLRQIYQGAILAAWFKETLKESLLGQVYVDRKKLKGVEAQDMTDRESIYDQYVKAFEKGVYNYIKEDYDPQTQQVIPRQYFSGGSAIGAKGVLRTVKDGTPEARKHRPDRAMLTRKRGDHGKVLVDLMENLTDVGLAQARPEGFKAAPDSGDSFARAAALKRAEDLATRRGSQDVDKEQDSAMLVLSQESVAVINRVLKRFQREAVPEGRMARRLGRALQGVLPGVVVSNVSGHKDLRNVDRIITQYWDISAPSVEERQEFFSDKTNIILAVDEIGGRSSVLLLVLDRGTAADIAKEALLTAHEKYKRHPSEGNRLAVFDYLREFLNAGGIDSEVRGILDDMEVDGKTLLDMRRQNRLADKVLFTMESGGIGSVIVSVSGMDPVIISSADKVLASVGETRGVDVEKEFPNMSLEEIARWVAVTVGYNAASAVVEEVKSDAAMLAEDFEAVAKIDRESDGAVIGRVGFTVTERTHIFHWDDASVAAALGHHFENVMQSTAENPSGTGGTENFDGKLKRRDLLFMDPDGFSRVYIMFHMRLN